jgi:hypothetical protein
MIVGGEGICRTPEQTATLSAGTIFVIPAETKHSFHTTNSVLRVVAWHPDSDTGPRHDDHPMVNRTIINGISASQIPEIHTWNAQNVQPIIVTAVEWRAVVATCSSSIPNPMDTQTDASLRHSEKPVPEEPDISLAINWLLKLPECEQWNGQESLWVHRSW